MRRSWMHWPIRPRAHSLPISVRRFSRAINRRRRRYSIFTRPRSRSGGRSSRPPTSGAPEAGHAALQAAARACRPHGAGSFPRGGVHGTLCRQRAIRTSSASLEPALRSCEPCGPQPGPGGFAMRAMLGAIATILLCWVAPALAQEWPQRQVTIVVPFGAGGSADLLARLLANHLQAKYGTPFVIENRAGAGGSTGTGYVAKAPADGATLLLGTVSSIAVNAALYSKLPFDVDRDLQPISQLVSFPNLLVVDPKLPVRDIPQLIAYLKANDGKINYGSSGLGTSSHLSVVMLERAIGTKMTHVPFRSTGEVVNSMLGGNIQLAIDSMTTIWPQAEAGQVRALGVSTPKRSPSAPDVPAIGETVQGYEAIAWQGLFAPAGTPRPVVDRIAGEVRRIWSLPEVVAALTKLGAEPVVSTPDEFMAFTRAERVKWAEVVKAAGVQID